MTVSTRTASALGRLRWRGPSRMLRTRRDRLVFGTAAVVVAAALIAGGVLLYRAANQGKQISALFSETIGVYPGSTVRILGVPVGTVDAVHPQGRLVRVTMTLDSGVKVPAGARAVVLAPSVVADRYVQLVPAYTGGPQIGNDAVIPPSRTAVQVEVDQVYAAITKLSESLHSPVKPLRLHTHGGDLVADPVDQRCAHDRTDDQTRSGIVTDEVDQ